MRFSQNKCPNHIFVLAGGWGVGVGVETFSRSNFLAGGWGGGGETLIYFKFVLSLCNQISTSTFDLRFALLVPPQSENASYAPEFFELTKVWKSSHRVCIFPCSGSFRSLKLRKPTGASVEQLSEVCYIICLELYVLIPIQITFIYHCTNVCIMYISVYYLALISNSGSP